MEMAFFIGMVTGMLIMLLIIALLGFIMKNAVFIVNCDEELTVRVHRTVALYEAEQYTKNAYFGE